MNSTIFNYLKKFNNVGREFIESPNESHLDTMKEFLDAISNMEFHLISPDKIDITVFFSTLWDVMSHPNGPHSNGISVLLRASNDLATRQMLTQSYGFMPILADILLNKEMSLENRIVLLRLMKDLSNGIKINWREPYLNKLIAFLCNCIMDPDKSELNELFINMLSILVNLCYGNVIVVKLLVDIVDMKRLIKFLVYRKSGSGDVQVCRFLMIVNSIKNAPSSHDVHNYLEVALKNLTFSIKEINENGLHDVDLLIDNLCSDPFTKPYVGTYDHYETRLDDALKLSPGLFIISSSTKKCLHYTINILQNLVNLGLFSLRCCHKLIAELCVNASNEKDLLGQSLNLLGAIILQYEEDGMLPDELMPVISIGFRALLDPSNLDLKMAGLDWMRFISALCDCHATREAVYVNVNVEKFENVFKQSVAYHTQKSNTKNRYIQEVLLVACHVCLSLNDRSELWRACLHRILYIAPVFKIMNGLVDNIHKTQRKLFFQMIRNPDFPLDRINKALDNSSESFNSETLNNSQNQTSSLWNTSSKSLPSSYISSAQEHAVDELIANLNNQELDNGSISSIMELYGYKISNLEHRLNACNSSLESANKLINSLNHSVVILEGTIKNQEDLLYKSQLRNIRLEGHYKISSQQIIDAENTIKKFQGKLAAEKLDRQQQFANVQWNYSQEIKELEAKVEENASEFERLNLQIQELNSEKNLTTEKLNDQTQKNGELASVLIKFEDKVKQKEKKLDEAHKVLLGTKNELELSQQNVKSLEKTLLERDKRLTQVTTQLEEMHKIQDMIANLMTSKASTSNSMG